MGDIGYQHKRKKISPIECGKERNNKQYKAAVPHFPRFSWRSVQMYVEREAEQPRETTPAGKDPAELGGTSFK